MAAAASGANVDRALPVMRVLIAVRARLYRDGLSSLLRADGLVEIVGTAADRLGALDQINALRPDVVLVDTSLEGGLGTIKAIASARPDVRVVAIAVPDRDADVIGCAEAGASAYVTLDASTDELVETLQRAAKGELICSPRLTASLFRQVSALSAQREAARPVERLTARERQIVELLDEGLTNKQIAQRLYIEVPTVKNHVHHILDKLHVSRRDDVLARLRAISG